MTFNCSLARFSGGQQLYKATRTSVSVLLDLFQLVLQIPIGQCECNVYW